MSLLQVKAPKKESIWTSTQRMPEFGGLDADVQADVCVVGAGIAGLTTAYLLTEAGKSVVVLEDGSLASGMTRMTTAHLASAIDDRFVEMERIHGPDGARLAAQSHAAAIDRIEALAAKERIDCDFSRLDGYLLLSPGDSPDLLDRELAAAHRAGLTGAQLVARAPLEPFDTGRCIRFPDQGQFHPLKYLAGLSQAIVRGGGRIFTQTHAGKLEGGDHARVEAGQHTVRCGAIVVATNNPINDLVAIHTKQAAYMTYVIGARVPRGSVTRALYWDTQDPYHYVRLQEVRSEQDGSAYDLLIVGGEDHRTGQASDTAQRHERLESWARSLFPDMGEIELTWAGQVMETIDGLAFIGRNPLDRDNVYIVTGDSGMGMTHGTIAGMLLTDLILGRPNPWAALYDPARKRIKAAGTYARETLNMALQYADWITPSEIKSASEIPNGHGAVLRRGLSKIAVYRDENGRVHERSAVCGHLGCIVHWNDAASTWDCPCHGSRFDKLGKVINGPANSDL